MCTVQHVQRATTSAKCTNISPTCSPHLKVCLPPALTSKFFLNALPVLSFPCPPLDCPLAGAGGPATKESLEEILEALPNINDVTVSRSTVDEQGGYEWLVTFVDPPGDVPQLTLGRCTWQMARLQISNKGAGVLRCWGAGVGVG